MTDDLDNARRTAESWHLGQTSARYESGPSGAGTISTGKGDHGGVSYGSYQLSSKMGTLKEYLDQSPYGEQFKGLTPATPAFDAKWRELAKNDPGFGRDQHDFIGRSHYNEQDAGLKARGIDLSGRGMAVQDALWSTSVQCRGLTPGIFENGLKEKFGDKYDLSKLSDKDIVDAVQDYKTNHVKTLFSKSPDLHESLKERFANEKASLDKLADADRVLKENGVTVAHTGRAATTPTAAPDHGAREKHDGTLRLHDHSEQVRDLQTKLAALGYRGADGKPLSPDADYGANTKHAVEAFQRDHHLKVDGIAGKNTLSEVNQLQGRATKSLADPEHPGNPLYTQALKGVYAIDAQQGRTPDALSGNLAASLALKSNAEGLGRIDHVLLSDDARTAYAVQGDMNSPLKKYAEVDVSHAVAQPFAQTSQQWGQQASQADQQQQQQQQTQPGMAR